MISILGICVDYNDENALACAGNSDNGSNEFPLTSACFNFDGDSYERVDNTYTLHTRGRMARYENTALIISGINSTLGTTEIYNPTDQTWSIASDFTGLSLAWDFTAVALFNYTYTFGGMRCETVTVADPCYRPKFIAEVFKLSHDNFRWYIHSQKMLGVKPRMFHSSIAQGNIIIHFGGADVNYMEAWEYKSDQTFVMTESKFSCDDWSIYPYMFRIDQNEYQN